MADVIHEHKIHGRDGKPGYTIKYTSQYTVNRIEFDRWNNVAKVNERISIHWTHVFQWADNDPCGGMNLRMVEWGNGSKSFASGLYDAEHGLMVINVGASGVRVLWREYEAVPAAA